MEDRESAAGVKRLVLILRRVTFAVQVLPFVYSSLYIVSLVLYGNVPEEAQMAADSLLYVSPVCIAAFLVLSRILKLCRWHRTACVIPAVPLVVNFIDYAEFLNTTIHEIVHITQDISHEDGIEPWGEDFAYLAGDISRMVSDIVCEASCPHCRRR